MADVFPKEVRTQHDFRAAYVDDVPCRVSERVSVWCATPLRQYAVVFGDNVSESSAVEDHDH